MPANYNPNSSKFVGLEWPVTNKQVYQASDMNKCIVQGFKPPYNTDNETTTRLGIYIDQVIGNPFYRADLVVAPIIPLNIEEREFLVTVVDANQFYNPLTGSILTCLNEATASPDDTDYVWKDQNTGGLYGTMHVSGTTGAALRGRIAYVDIIFRCRTTYTGGAPWPIIPLFYRRATPSVEVRGAGVVPSTSFTTYSRRFFFDPISDANGMWKDDHASDFSTGAGGWGWGFCNMGTLEDVSQMAMKVGQSDWNSVIFKTDTELMKPTSAGFCPVNLYGFGHSGLPILTSGTQYYLIITPVFVNSNNYALFSYLTPALDSTHSAGIATVSGGVINQTPAQMTMLDGSFTFLSIGTAPYYHHGQPYYAAATTTDVSNLPNAIYSGKTLCQYTTNNAAVAAGDHSAIKIMACAPNGTPSTDLIIEIVSAPGGSVSATFTVAKEDVPASPTLLTATIDGDTPFGAGAEDTQYCLQVRSTCTEGRPYRVSRLATDNSNYHYFDYTFSGQAWTTPFAGAPPAHTTVGGDDYSVHTDDGSTLYGTDAVIALGTSAAQITNFVAASNDTTGSVALSWNATGLGADFLMYKILRRKHGETRWQVFKEITNAASVIYTDSVVPLNLSMDYGIVQLSTAYQQSIPATQLDVGIVVPDSKACLSSPDNSEYLLWFAYAPPVPLSRPRLSNKYTTWNDSYEHISQAVLAQGYTGEITTEFYDYVLNPLLTAEEQYRKFEQMWLATDVDYVWYRDPLGRYTLPVKITDPKKTVDEFGIVKMVFTIVQVAEGIRGI